MAQIGTGTLGNVIIPGVIVVAFVIPRRWREATILVLALAASSELVQILKIVIHRSRPPHSIVDQTGWSFPSGHAAHATTLVVCASAAILVAAAFDRAIRRLDAWSSSGGAA